MYTTVFQGQLPATQMAARTSACRRCGPCRNGT